MSYILDALRRADSERERGAVPGLHAQPVPSVSDDAPPRAPRPWLWAAIGLALGLLAAFAWFATRPDATPPAPASLPVETATSPQARTAPAPSAEPPVAPVADTPAPTVTFPPQAAQPPRSEVPRPQANKASAAGVATAAPPAKASASASASAAAATAAASAPEIVAYKDLPEAVRRELPPLAIGGSVYSDVAANRFVVINGNVFHEKDTLAPQLTLEQIRAKSAVLRYRTWRYEITF